MDAFTARWILPLDRPALPGGILVLDRGRTVALEPHGSRSATDLGDVALLPGLVNAHTHLDLCGMAGLAPPQRNFPAWLRQVIAHRRSRAFEAIDSDIRYGIAECVRWGTTLVGDISGDGASWPLLAESGLGGIVFREVLGLTPERAALARETLRTWASTPPTTHLRRGISPHAPYSVHRDLFAEAGTYNLPVCTHLAESPEEMKLLANHRGPFVDFLQGLGVWHPEGLSDSPAAVLAALAPSPSCPVLLAHGNYLDPQMPELASATVVYCPRTHAAFGHPPHPFREMQARGVRVVLGTDSLASNPDLDILAEVRFLQERHPDIPVIHLLQMATDAEALGFPRDAGGWIAVPIAPQSSDPYRAVLESTGVRVRIGTAS
jgi:cytosine/adenosine deaminase-related metal-dependent hydrolase